MASGETSSYSPLQLGVLSQHSEAAVSDTEQALEVLREFGLSSLSSELRSGIGVALVHSSYLYENRRALPGVTKGLLDALNRLGGTFLRRLAAAEGYQRSSSFTSDSLSKHVAQIVFALPSWTSEQTWLRQSSSLGRSLNRTTLPAKQTANLFRQLLGVLSLSGNQDVAARILKDFISTENNKRTKVVNDPKTLLQEQLRISITPLFEYYREGPDHDTVFRAVFTDNHGHQGVGIGKSKKLASQNASLDFLRRHLPHALAFSKQDSPKHSTPTDPLKSPMELLRPEIHAATVRRVQHLFSLPAAARPLLSQALIHASWAHENRFTLNKNNQQDNRALAFIGSCVLEYEHAFAATRHILIDPPEEFSHQTVSNETYSSAFQKSGLSPGFLMGAGHMSKKIAEEVGANTLQAVIAAIYLAKECPDSLADDWPAEWNPVWRLVAHAEPGEFDATTLLQQATVAMRLETTYAVDASGPDHEARYQATITLNSLTLDVKTAITSASSTTKTRAKRNSSQYVLNILNQLANKSPARSLAGASGSEKSLARFLLAHQFSVLAMHPTPIQRWMAYKLFGFHFASSLAKLLEWANEADELLGLRITSQSNQTLQDAFRSAIEKENDSADTISSTLAQTLDALEQLDVPEKITQEHLHYLVQLCGVYRCLGVNDPGISLPELASDWRILHRGQLQEVAPMPNVQITGRERAIIDAALSAAIASGAVSVEVLSILPLHLRFLAENPLQHPFSERFGTLWSNVSKTTIVTASDQSIDVKIAKTDIPTEPGPIVQAVLEAMHPRPQPYQAAVADLLHDLKNQLVAGRLAASLPTENRTSWFQQQFIANRHLDQARALMLRLRAASSLLRPAGTESTELGTFLRHYAGTVLTRLPAAISLSIPKASSAVRVALDAHAFTAILDNLVGNAMEALKNGGTISLEWTADDYEAVVEIADNGPGIPYEVIAAFTSGQQIRSTKLGGNGLGLLGVRSLLNRVGGQITYVPAPSGTAWLITLPIVTAMAPESP